MNADSPAATSGGNGRSNGCEVSVMRCARCYASADVVVLQCLLERFPGDSRPDGRIELREGSIERAVLNVAAHAGTARTHRVSRGGVGFEHVEAMAFLVVRVYQMDLVVG